MCSNEGSGGRARTSSPPCVRGTYPSSISQEISRTPCLVHYPCHLSLLSIGSCSRADEDQITESCLPPRSPATVPSRARFDFSAAFPGYPLTPGVCPGYALQPLWMDSRRPSGFRPFLRCSSALICVLSRLEDLACPISVQVETASKCMFLLR